MKQSVKTLTALASVLALVAVAGGCNRSERGLNAEYVQTHQDDEVTRLGARMFQRTGDQNRMGSIRFGEKDSGLQMRVDLKDTRPNTEYRLVVYDMAGCDVKRGRVKNMATEECEFEKTSISLPALNSDAKGNIQSSFLINGVTAAELENTKLVLTRRNTDGNRVTAGWGVLKTRGWF